MGKRKLYKNDRTIRLKDYNYSQQLSLLDLKAFPLIDDFQITLKGSRNWGMHLYYFNNSLNRKIASFPWWDNAEKDISIMCISDIPLGTLRNPFNDCEQSWQILIWEKRDYVYIMQGDDPCCTEFPIWFRVRKEKYLAEWEKLLTNFH
ncbi:hypothetical protein DSECCO2_416270 [anaerobic digester metagenome]